MMLLSSIATTAVTLY